KAPELVDFIHDTFKEFLAGEYFYERRDIETLSGHLLDADWIPVIEFAIGRDNLYFASDVIETLLCSHSRGGKFLAIRCRGITPAITEDTSAKVETALRSILPPNSPEAADAWAACGNLMAPS